MSVSLILAACSTDDARGPGSGGPDGSLDSAVANDGSARSDAADGAADASLPWGPGFYPERLSQTGLFTDIPGDVLAPDVQAFQPKYVLWSDGATKRRWICLPAGQQIDTSDMDYWKYPVGTKVWKEFTVNGVRVETRLQYKSGPNKGDWVMIAYQWRSDLSDADAVPDGVQNANGTPHDIPKTTDCQFCHGNMKDSLLGFSAIQLSHSLPGVTMTELMSKGRLSNPPSGPFTLPGGSVAESALGYLHANCGTCHNPASGVYLTTSLRLWESTSALGSVTATTAYQTAVGRPNGALPQYHIIEPGYPDRSEMILRMSVRGTSYPTQMPPVATELVDTVGLGKVRTWIASLPPIVPDGGGDAGDAGDAHAADAAGGG